jgi:hypothetical protein
LNWLTKRVIAPLTMRTPPAVFISRLICGGSVLTIGRPRVSDAISESDNSNCFRSVERKASYPPASAPAATAASSPSASAVSAQVIFGPCFTTMF